MKKWKNEKDLWFLQITSTIFEIKITKLTTSRPRPS
jgi:hypothetical protein